MAKKWKKKEIEDYISTKQISQENYVAPTVEIGTAPSYKSVANTVDTFNNVSNNIKNKTTMSFDDKEPTTGHKLGFIGKSAGAGLTSGVTGIVDAPLQNIQEGAQKGKKKGKLENYLQGLARTLDIYGLSTMPETAKEVQQIVQDKNKKGWEKALNIGGAILNNNPLVNNLEASGQQLNIVDKNSDKNIKKAREIVETPSNKLNESVAKDSEKMSGGWKIAGEVSQTIGNMIPSMALTAVSKNPDIGLAAMGVSAKGQATKESEEKGSDLSTANEIGLGKGLVEVGTEKLTGGLKFFGKGTADDLVEKGINKAIKNKAGNFIAKQAVGMAGEVGEETISDLVGTAIDKATVDPDASYSFDDWKKTALMTMLSTGALNTISGGYGRKAYQLNAEELNDIAQSKKVQDTVNERVEQFKTPDMTPEQVEQLREQTTAVVLGEIQQNVDDILDSSIAQLQEQPQIPTQTPINAISSNIQEQNNQILGQQQTPQITPLNQVNQELQETRQNDIANQVQAMNLETPQEFTQKQGNYVYEKSDNSKIDNLRKDAANYLKEGEQTTNFVNTLEKLVKDKDIEIRFDTKLGNNVNGTYKNGVITINPNSNRAGEFVAIHELTHAIGTKPMIDMIQKYRNSNAEFNNAVERLLSTYKTTEINEEALGDIAGQLFGNQEYINNLSMENPSLFKKIYNEIKYLWHQFTGYKNQDQFIEDLRNKWESAYRNSQAKQTSKTGYSINENVELKQDNTGRELSKQQQEYFKNSKARDENGNLIELYHGTPNDFTKFNYDKLGTNGTLLGKGFYLTDDINVGEAYANKSDNGKIMKLYADIQKPLKWGEKSISKSQYKDFVEAINEETNGTLFADYSGEYSEKGSNQYNSTLNDILMDYEYGGDDIDLISGLLNSTGMSWEKAYRILKDVTGYDGIIVTKDVYDSGEGNVYIPFLPEQIKNVDNLNPTEDPDIRYSKDNQTWREYLEKEFPSQGTRTNLQDINERNKPKQENKTTQEEKPQEMPKNEVKQEVKKSYLTSAEQNELDGLKSVENSGFAELTKKEQARMEELEKKSQGITKKFPELSKTVTQEDTKPLYFKYKDNEISKENNKILNEAKKIVESNNQGRRTKEQWLQVAEYIGSNADIKNSTDLQKLAMETWLASRPNTKDNLNRQGKKYVDFKTNEWFNAMYKGAGVGTDVKMSLEEATDTKGNKVDLKPTGNNVYERVNVKPTKNQVIPDMSNKVLNIGNEKVSNFYSNITEKSKFITEENRESLKDNANLKYYDAITNKDTLGNAMDKLNKNPDQQIGDFFAKKNFDAEDVATGWILVKRYQDAGNYEAMSNVIEKMREQGTKAGQTVQMYGILQRLTPEGMEYYSQKQLDNAFKKFSEGKSKQKIDQYAPDFTLTAKEHQFIKDTMEKVQNMTDEEQKKVEIAKIVAMLNEKIPPEKGQRLKAWMRIAMLGNPKTQVRNVAGNAIIQPVNWVGDVFSATADKIISKKTGKRTIGTTDFAALVQGTKKGFKDAVRDAKTGVDTRDINLDRFEENIGANPFYEKHEGAKRILNPAAKVLNKTNKILGNIMSGGDRIFYQAVYDNSLQNQMKLNKVDTPTQEMMDIAEQEALSRTWNDSNSYTKSVLQIRNAMNKLNVKGYGLGDVLVPFAKTPANLTKAIVDYSPVGLTRTILSDGKKLSNSLENGQYNAQLQHQFADSFGKGVAGTILWTAAYALAKAGITSGKSDDDKDVSNFMRNTLGIQPYSIKIGDKSFTYDWAQPIAAPFAAMSDYQSLTDKEKKDLGSTIEKMTSSASNILLEQSFLSSIQDVFNSYEGPTAAIKQQIQDLPARATPTFFKQIADLIDPTSRQTFVKGDTKETMKNKVQVKIPGKSKELVEQRDTLGREIKKYGGDEDKLKYAFNVFLNPANTNKGKTSKAAEEIYEVYKATGDKTIMPRQVGYSEMINGESRNLTAKERSEWQKLSGEKIEENVKALTSNSKYQSMSDEDKAAVINGIVNYSFAKAKSDLFDTNISTMYKTAAKKEEQGIPLYDYYIERISKRR